MRQAKKKANAWQNYMVIVVLIFVIYIIGALVQQYINMQITQISAPPAIFQMSVQTCQSKQFPRTTTSTTEQNIPSSLKKVVQDFIYPRDHPSSNFQNMNHTCNNRHLNSSCFNSSNNLWHPQYGSPLKFYTPQDFAHGSQCLDMSILYIGDSRVRTLFATVANIYHKNTTKIHRLSANSRDESMNLVTPTILKHKWDSHIKSFHKTMYTYIHERDFESFLEELEKLPREERISHLLNNQPAHRFHVEWDPLLTITLERLNKLLENMHPGLDAVVVEGGLWHIRNNLRDFDTFRAQLVNITHYLLNFKETRKASFKVIFFLNDKPLRPKAYNLHDGDMDLLNNVSKNVANKLNSQSGKEEIIVWDSHLALQSKFAEICTQHTDALVKLDGDAEMWRCKDPTHSGRIMFEHYAQMLVNYICEIQHS